ncbi:CHAD domain-containing protein [Actinacidiphila yeochonensis]|uniref:CHAD domain-containing protein n=1 Tax=Actinacidiphila yeochonensis TaxID=89050 RepID=UPI000ADC9531|nr:CHAD domain-containing protein [Actinacidiphila yeochonensis]
MGVSAGADGASAGEALSRYLGEQATGFLRGLGLRGQDEAEADRLLRGSARRISGVLHTYADLVDPGWAEPVRTELGWLAGTLGREPQYSTRLGRLVDALRRLSAVLPAQQSEPEPTPARPPVAVAQQGRATGVAGRAAGSAGASAGGAAAGPLAVGAARAGALLERQLTLARARAHSATLQAMGSSRFHALADSVAVLASEAPLAAVAAGPAREVLPPLAATAHARLVEAAASLPLGRAGHPYNAEAVRAALGAELAADLQDAPWHQVRVLLRLSRYATEVPGSGGRGTVPAPRLAEAAAVLQRHHEASESAAAVAAAARTPRIAPATAYALGVLHADQRHEVEAARFAFSRLWQS